MTILLWLLASLGWPLAIITYLVAQRWRAIAAAHEDEAECWHDDYQAQVLASRGGVLNRSEGEAQHGVTRCPLAAVEVTTATISAEDRAAIAAHQKAREDAFWESGCGAGLLKSGHRGGSVRAKRGRS